jgi:transposase
MLALSDAQRYFLYCRPADMRKSFYSLASIVEQEMQGNALSGDIFIFLSRRRNQIKLLVGARWLCYLQQTSGRGQLRTASATR